MPTLNIAVDGNYNPHIHVFLCLCGIVSLINPFKEGKNEKNLEIIELYSSAYCGWMY